LNSILISILKSAIIFTERTENTAQSLNGGHFMENLLLSAHLSEWDIKLAGEMAVHVTSPAPREVWSDLVNSDPESIIPQSPEWVDVICACGKYKNVSRLYEFPGGRKLVLPLVRRRRRPPMLSMQASMPKAWGIGGLVGYPSASPEEISAMIADVSSDGVLSTSIRPNPLYAEAWSAARFRRGVIEPRCAHILDMDCGFDDIWSKKFSHQARGSVRKAERCGLQVECDTGGRLIDVYYDLMMCSVNRWADQQHEPRILSKLRAFQRDPFIKIKKIAEGMGEAFHTWIAWLDGKPAAALLVLQGTNVYCFKSAMDKELAGPTHANELLHRLAIENGCRSGCRRYHLGESGSSLALAQFKQRLGAHPHAYAEYYIENVPVTQMDREIRKAVKGLIGFKDPS
jgi:hypothetical protein